MEQANSIKLKGIIDDIHSALSKKTPEVPTANRAGIAKTLIGNRLSIMNDETNIGSTSMIDRISNANTGSKTDKEFIKEEIYKLLVQKFATTITSATIDEIILQYHVNYYKPLYTGELEPLRKFLNENFLLHTSDSFDHKLKFLTQIIYQELFGLSVIDGFEYMENVNEIAANGHDYVWIQYSGIKKHIPNLNFESEEAFEEVIKKSISFDSKADLNSVSVEILCQRFNGSRVTALHTPYASSLTLNVRNFDTRFRNRVELIKRGVTCVSVEDFVDNSLPGRPGIIVIGDQGAGKTTYLCRLIASLPDDLAIGTMETMFEINAKKRHPEKNIDELQILPTRTAEQCFETFLRLDRDIIINGEIRSPQDALVTIKAMLRQGRGSMGSFHSTSVRDFPYDFRNLLMQSGMYTTEKSAEIDVARAIDLIIHLKLNRKTGKRFIGEVAELKWNRDADGIRERVFEVNTLFKYDKKLGKQIPVNPISEQLREHLCEYEMSEENLKIIDDIFKGCKK